MAQARQWCFTDFSVAEQLDPGMMEPTPDYAIYQLECSPTTCLPHFQGYLHFPSPVRLNALKRLLPTAHLETCKGTPAQNIEYCSKPETRMEGPWEYGVPPSEERGKRTDWEHIRDMCKEGLKDVDFAEQYPGHFARNYSGIKRLKGVFMKPRTEMPDVRVICGPPGTGKSSWARDNYPDAYWKPPNNKWWDYYDGEESVIIDEFKGWIPYNDLNKLCDMYPYYVEIKGTSTPIPALNVVLISNYHPADWYDSSKVMATSFRRRVALWSIYFTMEEHYDFTTYEEFDAKWVELMLPIRSFVIPANSGNSMFI